MREDQYPWAVQQVLAGRMFAMASLEDYPPEGAVDRETLRRYGVKSGVCLPLTVGGEPPIGALGLNVTREERGWPDALLRQLQLIAQVFTNALLRRRHEVSLQESEEVSRGTFEQAAVGLAHVDTDGHFLRVNDKLCAIVGYPREELLQLAFQDITHPDDLAADLEYKRQVLSGEVKTYSMEKRYLRKDGTLVWINLTVSLVRTATGEPRHFIAVVEDITDRKRAEEALRSSEARLAAAAELGGVGYVEVD
jgi:PAS domain S-box-containing protein